MMAHGSNDPSDPSVSGVSARLRAIRPAGLVPYFEKET